MAMKKTELKRFKTILESKRAALVANAQAMTAENMTLDVNDLPDEMDLASSEGLQSFEFRLRGREKTFLDKIDKALQKIVAGEFGVCEECGEEISVKRLEARPETTLCIRCKEDQERGLRKRTSLNSRAGHATLPPRRAKPVGAPPSRGSLRKAPLRAAHRPDRTGRNLAVERGPAWGGGPAGSARRGGAARAAPHHHPLQVIFRSTFCAGGAPLKSMRLKTRSTHGMARSWATVLEPTLVLALPPRCS